MLDLLKEGEWRRSWKTQDLGGRRLSRHHGVKRAEIGETERPMACVIVLHTGRAAPEEPYGWDEQADDVWGDDEMEFFSRPETSRGRLEVLGPICHHTRAVTHLLPIT